jgi:hypothetical protein
MRELRVQGYTFEAIRQALAAAGVHVSNATVQRELARLTKPRRTAAPMPRVTSMRADASPGDRSTAEPRSGKEIAEAFTAQHIANPLLRAKHTAKDVP